jgi:NhaP-type Na+/H+ or K+/H+ antiporter
VGEGITNDAVGIIIFNTVIDYALPGTEKTFVTYLIIIGKFLLLCVVSTLIGFLFGKLGAQTFILFDSLNRKPLLETLTIILFGFLSYFVADKVKFSGIIAVLSAGFTLKVFATPHLSE